ncbi:MAG: hypothetical protein ACOVNU_08900 [Candidatus Kapaibacteriota bacterium]|jgi:hypothetical protein
MTILEEKRNKVISNIKNTDDEYLKENITQMNKKNWKLTNG